MPDSVRKLTELSAEREHETIRLRAENERLREALRLGADMRSAQSAYFKTKTKDALIASKVAESDFDKICRAALKGDSDA